MKRLLAGLLAALLAWTPQAWAFSPGQPRNFMAPPYHGYGDFSEGPGTTLTTQAWWGFRAFSGQVAQGQGNYAANLRRSSDSVTCDVKVGWWGTLDLTANCSNAAINAQSIYQFCGGTSCFVATMYDQSHSINLTQATAANQPNFVLSCLNLKPCLTTVTGLYVAGTLGVTYAQPWVVHEVAMHTGNFGATNTVLGDNVSTQTGFNTTASQAFVYAGTQVGATAADGVWHTMSFTGNGASSIITVDGVLNTVSAGASAFNLATNGTAIGASTGISPTNPCACSIAEVALSSSIISVKGQLIVCHVTNIYYGLNLPC